MPIRCVALLSGGLDSMLAIRLMQEQQIEVEALNFKTTFTCCQNQSAQAARALGVPLTVINQEDDYLELVKSPRFGYGRGANPCVDCRIYMFERAHRAMQQLDAQFIISGEVVGQRPMSQKRRDLDTIAYHSGLEDLLLRPLSAKLLPPTLPERNGWVDRSKLHGFFGRSRKRLIQLAQELGIHDIPGPSTGCALTEVQFSRKVYDLIYQPEEAKRWDFELLQVGRHFRFDRQTKVVVGRREQENIQLALMHQLPGASSTVLLEPESFSGPAALVVGPDSEEAIAFAAGLVLRYSKIEEDQSPLVDIRRGGMRYRQVAQLTPAAREAQTLSTGEGKGKKGRSQTSEVRSQS